MHLNCRSCRNYLLRYFKASLRVVLACVVLYCLLWYMLSLFHSRACVSLKSVRYLVARCFSEQWPVSVHATRLFRTLYRLYERTAAHLSSWSLFDCLMPPRLSVVGKKTKYKTFHCHHHEISIRHVVAWFCLVCDVTPRCGIRWVCQRLRARPVSAEWKVTNGRKGDQCGLSVSHT